MKALLLIDIQNDFLPTGALPVAEGDQVVAVANEWMLQFELVIATQDWHPADHGSFAVNHPGRKPGEVIDLAGLPQILWPVHCVQNTPGAEFAPDLNRAGIRRVIRKGTIRDIDSYSGFFDNGHKQATGLHVFLRERGVAELFIMGLATDYCVKFTALDARKLGYAVNLIQDGCRGVNLKPGDVEAALEDMRRAGVKVMGSRSTPFRPNN